MQGSGGNRVTWADLPAPVRAWAGEVLGSPVVRATSQPGGFSPGSADRVVTADGRRAFVKAVGAGLNPHSPELHRQEAVVTGRLPTHPALPRLLATFDDGDWVALALEDVEGRTPGGPWRRDDVVACLGALAAVAGLEAPAHARLPPLDLTDQFAGWRRWQAADHLDGLDPWAAGRLDELVALSDRAVGLASGTSLVHGDVRADNLLVRPDGSAVVVDWPHAAQGCGWFDTVCLLHSVEVGGGVDIAPLVGASALAEVDDADLASVLAGLAAYFTWQATLPPIPGLPRVREFQRVQGVAALRWLRRLWAR